LASVTKPNWSMTIPRVHRILSILCTELLKNHATVTGSYKKGPGLALEMIPTWCLWGTEDKDVL
jgi:hypothetical protein